jgi:ABC-type transporter Mla MlaB component
MSGRGPTTIVCDLAELAEPDVGTVGALARLQLTARQAGLDLRLSNATSELEELIAFVGLEHVLRVERAA